MADIVQFVVVSTIRSGLYALVAIGFTLIFGVGGVLNLAHGASLAVGAYAAFFATRAGFGVGGAVVASLVVPALFGVLLYLVVIRRFEHEPVMVMILTLVTAVAIEQVILTSVGAQPVALPQFLTGNVSVAGTNVQYHLLAVFALSWAVILGLFVFVNYTRVGKAILATSMSAKGASLVGIRSDRINLLTWAIAGALAGIAGMALGSQLGASFAMGRTPLILSFSIVVVGGIGSIRGSVVGAYLIGFLEIGVLEFVSQDLVGIAPLLVLVVVLLVKPEGMFGRELAE